MNSQPEFDADLNFYELDEKIHRLTQTKTNMPTKTNIDLTYRHFPDSPNEFLRHQFGIEVLRPLRRPLYVGRVVVDTVETNSLTTVFHLLGYSATKAKAKAAALDAAYRLGLL